MFSNKNTKRSLLMSVLALVLCVSMLIGSTFAWFTDSVTSVGNKIQAGTLKLDLELLDKETGNWNSIKTSQAPIFNHDKWEPGYTDVKILKVENEGNLALKWYAKFVSGSTLTALADVIDVYVCPSETDALTYPADRSLTGYTKVGTVSQFVDTIETTTYGKLDGGKSAYLGIALKMQESAGNEYQGMELGVFDIMILATQNTVEADSVDNQYDANAKYAVPVGNIADAKAALAEGKDMILTDDIQVKSGELMLSGGTLDGDGQEVTFISGTSTLPVLGTTGGTVQNLTVNGDGRSVQGIGAGMTTENALTEDLYIKNVTVDGVMYAVIGTAQNVNVTVTDSTLYGAFSYPGAAKVTVSGSVLGAGNSMYDFFEVTSDITFANCTFEDGYCFLAYAASAGKTVEFINCNVEGVALTAENFKSLMIDDRWDYGEPASTYMEDCAIAVNGTQVIW